MPEAICAIKKDGKSFMVYTFKDLPDMKANKIFDVWECKTVLADSGTVNYLTRIQSLVKAEKRRREKQT